MDYMDEDRYGNNFGDDYRDNFGDNYNDNYNDEFNNEYNDDFNDNDNYGGPPPMGRPPKNRYNMNFNRKNQYNNAYGEYRGGYGPPGAFFNNWRGPPPNCGPSGNFGPPPLFPQYPPGPPGPSGFTWGRGFGPNGPPMKKPGAELSKTLKYLHKCGVPRENLKSLPRNLLQMFEPEYCGLCAHTFDTFSVSRMHYISKNHLKNQKKWLTQQNDPANHRRNKEIPLKARELYCELCDVHITSKVHAESHYAGKPHRAIVEGRKNPRNPFLVQRGMENRVEQLIRREKKFIKASEEDEESEPQPVEPKVIPPELFCDICKTSMTCTEQMTMHMNGKRHLAKEKHHILKMMKIKEDPVKREIHAPQEDPAAAVTTATEEAPAAGEDNQNNDVPDEEEDNGDDWANGNGTWDEPTKD